MKKQFGSHAVWLAAGLALAAWGVLWSDPDVERWALGSATGRLGWGATLFRAMLVLNGAALAALGAAWRRIAGARSGGPWITRTEVAGLTALMAAAAVLRFYRLDSQLWVDEVFTLLDYGRASMGEIFSSFPSKNNHLLYSALARLSVGAWGESAWALRLPAAVFGALTPAAVYLLGRKLWNPRVGAGGALLVTVSYHHVWFSQNARGYSGLLLFTVLATWLWLQARDRGGLRWWAAYAAAAFLGLAVQLAMVFTLLAHGLVWLFGLRKAAGRVDAGWVLGAWTFGALWTLQFYALGMPELLGTAIHEPSANAKWTLPSWLVGELLRNLGPNALMAAGAILGAALALGGCRTLWKRRPEALPLMLGPGVLVGAAVVAMRHNIWPRVFFFCMGFAVPLAVAGGWAAAERLAVPRRAGWALVLLLAAASASTLPRCYRWPKQDFLGAKSFVESQRAQGETAAAAGLAGPVYARYYAPQWPAAVTIEQLRRTDPDWLVYTLPIEIQAFQPAVWDVIEREYEIMEVFPGTLGQGEVFVSRRRDR